MMQATVKGLVWLIACTLFLVSCDDPHLIVPQADHEDHPGATSIHEVVESTHQRYLGGMVGMTSNQLSFLLENDGLIDEYIADDRTFRDSRPHANRLLDCLRTAELTADQRPQIARALQAHRLRNERIIQAHRREVMQLRQQVETARQQLYRRFQAGDIDREQFRERMLQLRERFQEGLNDIRQSNAGMFSRSYRQLLEHLQGILTEEQWETFTTCLAD